MFLIIIFYILACGGTLQGQTGILNAPGYPEKYLPNQFCRWYIEAADSDNSELDDDIMGSALDPHPDPNDEHYEPS